MAEDDRARQKAVRLVLSTYTAWDALAAADFTRPADMIRFSRAANKTESALFRLSCADLADPAPRVAYAEVAGLRSWVQARVKGGTLFADAAVSAARGALWALHRDEFDPERIPDLPDEPPAETPFAHHDGEVALLHLEKRVAAAAEARFALADRLATFQRQAREEPTPAQLDATLAARDKFYRTDEAMVWTCRLASCHGRDASGEARILGNEALDIYRALAARGNQYNSEDAARAFARREALQKRLPLHFG
jgi:hypothetical protein